MITIIITIIKNNKDSIVIAVMVAIMIIIKVLVMIIVIELMVEVRFYSFKLS